MHTTDNIAILGFGKEGISTYQYLRKIGIQKITIRDKRSLTDFDDIERNILKETPHILGEDYLDGLEIYDTIIKSPGISPYHEKIMPLRHKITSQTQIFFDNFPGKIIAVTGTKGKSTTTTLIYQILREAGLSVEIIGNIGNPVLDSLDTQYEYAVFEMSSYMLDGVEMDPYISVIVNLYPEHLDYHHGWENYKKAKKSIIGKNSLIIYPSNMREELGGYLNQQKTFGENGDCCIHEGMFTLAEKPLLGVHEIQLLGEHNQHNICAALLVADALQIPMTSVSETLRHFRGLRHRLEHITTKNDIDFYDDAISTTPESTIAAIRAIPQVETLFLGGTNRGYQFEKLIDEIQNHSSIRNLVFFPDTGMIMRDLFGESINKYRVLETRSMQEAVAFAYKNTTPGKCCLLSCASPSYTLWKNFEVKGDEFGKYVLDWHN